MRVKCVCQKGIQEVASWGSLEFEDISVFTMNSAFLEDKVGRCMWLKLIKEYTAWGEREVKFSSRGHGGKDGT